MTLQICILRQNTVVHHDFVRIMQIRMLTSGSVNSHDQWCTHLDFLIYKQSTVRNIV